MRKQLSEMKAELNYMKNFLLTGAEVSINTLPAGANVPFVHSHKNNEEIYGIIAEQRQSCDRR